MWPIVLTPVGLSAFDETVLRRLLSVGAPHTPATPADELGAPPEQVRRSLRRLIELGLALRDGVAVMPALGLDRPIVGGEQNREELCELLWRMWSPTWEAAAAEFPASAPSLHNPDFVAVVVHSYRHRYNLAGGDPRYQAIEERLADGTRISVPAVVLEPGADGIGGPTFADSGDRELFTGRFEYRMVDGVGHNLPQEAPEAFAEAVHLLGDTTAGS